MDQPADSGSHGHAPAGRLGTWLPRLLLESLMIVLSVLLALGLGEWRDQRSRDARARMALQSIQAELRENAESVERARANHRAMRDSLLVYADRQEAPPARIYLFGLFNPALVHSTAWTSASETGTMAQLPYELVLALSRVYDGQARYRALGDALAQDLMSQIRREGLETVLRDQSAAFIPLQEDFANRESALLEAYEDALADLQRGPAAFRSSMSSEGDTSME